MDIDDYLARLRADMDARLNGRLPNLGHVEIKPQDVGRQSIQEDENVSDAEDSYNQKPTGCVADNLPNEVRYAEDDMSEEDPLEDHWGIIMTNTQILAQKYGCSQSDVYDVFNDFVGTSNSQQMYWSFLDVANSADAVTSWKDCNALISEFIVQSNLQACAELHLFIIGGNDVIPIPSIADPYAHRENILTDMAYAFEGDYITNLINNEIDDIEIENVRNNVSRLPLEDGAISSDIRSDLESYFNISSMYSGGIPVGNVVMTSNSAWIPASTTMSQHLPLVCDTNDSNMTKNGMFISPELLTENEESVAVFRQSLQHADMLMFNLHGSDSRGMSGFYSNDGEAFNIPMLQDSTARVLNTVACFGARYNGYERDDSMLLSSMYGGGILLYTGSSKSVPMLYNNEARELLLNPGTGSEVFMRLYPLYQFKGMTAGKALLQAKLDYFNMCRHVEDDEFSLSTILMFNLYGNPMLHVRRREHVIESALENDTIPPAPVKSCGKPFQRTERQVVMQKTGTTQSLLSQVRGAVDANLEMIRKTVETHLYQELGLPPRTLAQIDKIKRSNSKGGVENVYSFYYHNSEAKFSADTRVEVDEQGTIKRIYTTK